jgi:hypothetical protein
MMPEYIEEFKINECSYRISDDVDHYSIWKGGSSIGKADSIHEARHLLHGYAVNQMRAEIGSYELQAHKAKTTLQRLTDDYFYLARFMV